jgi:hypothetical protein
VLDVRGAVDVVLEHQLSNGVWYELAGVSGTAAVYVGRFLPVPLVLTGWVRVRWSAGTFSLVLAALPPARVRAH